MKKTLAFLLLVLSCISFAQRNEYGGMLTASGGFEKNGAIANISYLNYINYNSYIDLSVSAHFEKFTFRNESFPVELYYFNPSYNYRIYGLNESEDYVLYGGLGLILGYENINNGNEFLKSGYQLTPKSQFVYGANLNLTARILIKEFGAFADNGLFLTITGKYNYLINSEVGERQPIGLIGLGYRF